VEAFNCLVSRWEKRLYNYLLRLLSGRPGYREDSLDLAQEAFLKAYQSIGTLQDAEKFPHWLFRIAHNLAFSHLRRPVLLESAEEGLWQAGSGNGPDHWSQEGPNDWEDKRTSLRRFGSASQPVFGMELEMAVSKALEALPPEQREAILLKVYHGFLFEEIAGITSCPLSTVKSRIYAGFARLRELLADQVVPRRIAARR
jgi:RNA polymerase sigma-70 factor (ECF subfamily)